MRRSRPIAALGLVVAAGVVVGVAGAITDVVPNSGFETACGTAPCDWSASLTATLTRDTTTFHSGAAGLRIDVPANSTGSANIICLPLALTPGNHDYSFWYNNSDPNILASATRFSVSFYSGANCSTFLAGDELLGTGTSGWLQATGTINVPAGTTGVFFTLYTNCMASGPCSGYYDDIDFEAEAGTAVTVSSFGASRAQPGVRVRWRTGTEVDTLGFHVYRSHGAKWTRVDRRLIPAKGSVSGARYSFLDRSAPHRKLTYRLQAVGTDGSRTWYGRASVGR